MGNYAIAITGGSTTKSHRVHPKLNSFAKIQAAVRAGRVKEYFDIGQELMTHYTYEGTVYDMPWVVLDNNRECVWPDGSRHPGLWIGSKYATIESLQFDAPEKNVVNLQSEPNALEGWFYWRQHEEIQNRFYKIDVATGDPLPTNYATIAKCFIDNFNLMVSGYGRYSHSAVRQWLNSDKTVGNWWAAQHLGDLPPTELNTINGFMRGLDSDFIAVINPVKIQANTNPLDGNLAEVMYDRFFLQSPTELFTISGFNDEGPYFPYWKNATGLNLPSDAANAGRIIKQINNPTGNGVDCRLRTMALQNLSYVWYMGSNGKPGNNGAINSIPCLPAACIS